MPLFGAHMSVSGGLEQAVARIRKVHGQALQIFTRNQRQWKAAPVTREEAARFKAAVKEWGEWPVASHDSYLINLASPKEETAHKSRKALTDEIIRCDQLAIPYLVMHPGSHMGAGVEEGIARFTRELDRVLAETREAGVTILLETTAGQGTNLGASFEELAAIIEQSRFPRRLGVCFDTCHAFAAGYDLVSDAGYRRTFTEFDRVIGLNRLAFFHVNDAKAALGSRLDRHTHIGDGTIGLTGFARLVNDPRFRDLPMVLETPKGEDLAEDIRNLKTLRSLVADPGKKA